MKFLFKRYKQLLVLLLVLVQVKAVGQATLQVPVEEIKKAEGQLLYSLYASADGFPDQPFKAFRKGSVPVTSRAVVITITDLPVGTYALSVIHDANGNGRLDMNRLGIPTESLGFSNNVMGAFGPPKFSKARFSLQQGKNEMPVRLRMGQ